MHDVWLHPTDKTSLILFIFTTMATGYSTLTLCNYLSVLLVSTERKASEREGGREGSEKEGGRGQRERREESGRQGERKGRR